MSRHKLGENSCRRKIARAEEQEVVCVDISEEWRKKTARQGRDREKNAARSEVSETDVAGRKTDNNDNLQMCAQMGAQTAGSECSGCCVGRKGGAGVLV